MIREERPEDIEGIGEVHRTAFGQPLEAQLVDALRANGGVLLSLVALESDRVVGHVLFSPASLESNVHAIAGAGLGPMAVLPKHQRRGIGGRLIAAGIDALRVRGCPFIVVLGHPEYYPRFGFAPASQRGICCEWNVPDEAFMLLALDEGAMKNVSGLVKYRPEFAPRR